ncbi:hypothetical protein [Fusobacterium sp. MFO224]|uniref:hypothetical protein n=1 Tax=Fusobacterium sp. MFO224 TaxID=3378070 RepID=UPI00385461B4
MESEKKLLKNILLKYSKQNIIISTKILFNDNLEIMEKLEIEDFYMLFNKIYNLFKINNFNLTMESYWHGQDLKVYRPHLLFGETTKKEQLFNFLNKNRYSLRGDLFKEYTKKYGFTPARGSFKECCDFFDIPKKNKRYTKEKIIKKLLKKYHANGNKPLQASQISNSNDLPRYLTIKRYFNNINIKNIWEEVLSYEKNKKIL